MFSISLYLRTISNNTTLTTTITDNRGKFIGACFSLIVTIQELSMVSYADFFSFFNYFAAQVSAWFRVFICLDRYLNTKSST